MSRVRWLLIAPLLSGCLGGGLGAHSRPGVIPKLSELPGDPEKRDAVLNQSGDHARLEQRKSLTKRQRKAETTAALMAALIGQAFSKTENVTLGVATDVDENLLFERPSQRKDGTAPKRAAVPAAPLPAGALVPWIKLAPLPPPAAGDATVTPPPAPAAP